VNLRVATPELVTQRVRKVLEGHRAADVLAVRAEPQWASGPLTVDQRRVEVQPCVSPLAVRATLAEWKDRRAGAPLDEGAGDLLVLLCDLSERDLGEDVLARLSPPRVLSLEPWDAAKALFGVKRVDAAFGKDDGWIAGALLAHVPTEQAQSLTGGSTLTVEVALDALARQLLGADSIGVDDVLAAAAGPNPFTELDTLDGDTRDGLLNALATANGPLGEVVAAVLRAGHGSDLLAIGLAARAVYGQGEHDGGRAAGRLEARCGGQAIEPTAGAALADRCEEAVEALLVTDLDRANAIIAEAAALAADVEAAHPEASDLLPAGYDQRVSAAVQALTSILDDTETGDADRAASSEGFGPLREALEQVRVHCARDSPSGRRRFAHLEMASRLVAWLASHAPEPARAASFEQAATRYVADGAWVDRARRRLWRGDDDGTVATVYRRVIDLVVARRSDENRRFAELLASWTAIPPAADTLAAHSLVTVEDVARDVLARFGDTPVLLVVLDGCGLASFEELVPQFREAGFREIARSSPGSGAIGGTRLTGVAALPTVTEVSRASLIAGHLDQGPQDHERRAFEGNAALKRHGRAAAFFHQNRLLGAAGESLSAEVSAALRADGPPVVGVVINTIDDQLKRGTFADELRLDDLHALVSLLDAARTHGRAVVVSADHGHVLAQPDDGGTGTFAGGGVGGERWRDADRPPAETEVLLRGPRVRLGGDAGVLAPWEDDYRYGAKAGGYHGGATPEEVLVPVAAYLPAGMEIPSGWEPFTEVPPLWWSLVASSGESAGATGTAAPVKPRKKPAKRVDESQPTMFDLPEKEAAPSGVASAGGTTGPAWLNPLLASEVWQAQKKTAGRASLPDDRVRAVLTVATRRGGVASFAEISAGTGLPPARLSGFLHLLARVLNVDGYPVLEVDATIQEVRLSLAILGQQFAIPVEAA